MSATQRFYLGLIGLLVLTVIMVVVLLTVAVPYGVDYHRHYLPAVLRWLNHDSLYTGEGFNIGPWAAWFLLPFVILPDSVDLILLRVLSILSIVWAGWIFSENKRTSPKFIILLLFNFHTFDLLQRGQIEAYSIAGITLGWIAIKKRRPWMMALAFIMLMIKPPNTIPICLFFLWLMARHWNNKEIVKAIIIPVLVLPLSFILNPGWIAEWRAQVQTAPILQTWLASIWRIQRFYEWPVIVPWIVVIITGVLTVWAWRRIEKPQEPDMWAYRPYLALIVAATFVATPYALSYHYVILLAVTGAYLAEWRFSFFMLLYVLTFLPIVRVWLGADYAWIDYALPLAAFGGVLLSVLLPDKHSNLASLNQPE